MRGKRNIICSLLLVASIMAPLAATPVLAEENAEVKFAVPESPSETYNMNLDWKFVDTRDLGADMQKDIWTVMAKADKDGKKFYEVDYDDSSWDTVSIPHGIGGGTNTFTGANYDAGGGYRSVLLYRKTFTVPQYSAGGKVFFELEGIRQGAYVWINGEPLGYYEAGIAAMGFDLTNYVKSSEQAVIAILDDGLTSRGTYDRIPYETVPGEKWGSSYSANNYKEYYGSGAAYVWNTKDFNEPQIGLVYDAYLHIKGSVYQTLPLYNNLKTTGNYIYADNFDIKGKTATIHVDAEIRNESAADGNYTLEVSVVDEDGNTAVSFTSSATEVKKATDAGIVYETAVESDVYSEANLKTPTGITKVNTPDVTYIKASGNGENLRFWTTDDPYLYTVYTILKDSTGKVVDVQKKETGFRKITYDANSGILINDKSVWMPGYAQRATNEWAVIGVATDWLQDFDMQLLKENNANFIRWMHVAPKPHQVRSSDKYGVAVVVPAGDKEGVGLSGREWSQRVEAMRDVMIYYRNSPSVVFWETGNSAVGSAANANDMARIRDLVDPYGMRFIGARSTQAADQMNYDYNYAGTMYGNYATGAINAMKQNGKMGPIMETEYARDEAPRRVWDVYSPPDYDYVNKYISKGGKNDNYDVWNETQEDISIANIREYNGYYANRAGYGNSLYSAAAMMVWSDSNMHTRNTATENDRTTGRVDAVRQTKEMFEVTKTAQSSEADVHIVGHWSYPEYSDDTYNYYGTTTVEIDGSHSYEKYNLNDKKKRNPMNKTVYVIGSADIAKVELYQIDKDSSGNETETLLGTDESAESNFIYSFAGIDVTKGDAVLAKAYDARGALVDEHRIERTYSAATLRVTPHTAYKSGENDEVISDFRADGADIVYFDVEVLDEKGNVCALNYDRINFEWSGDAATYLGGYNSGNGANCFQNIAESAGISNYFGGAKDGVSVIGKNYVYAENGTARIFARATRTAGTFTLTAKMDGLMPASATVTATAVETTGGLTKEMSATLEKGVTEAPVTTTVAPMKPLMLSKKIFDWSKVITVKEVDETTYYTIYVDGVKLDVPDTSRARLGVMDNVFGPLNLILQKLIDNGATTFTMDYKPDASPATLTVTTGGHTYEYADGRNQVLIDGTDWDETVDAASMADGNMISNLSKMLGYISGVSMTVEGENLLITHSN